MKRKRYALQGIIYGAGILAIAPVFFAWTYPSSVYAGVIDELQKKITEHSTVVSTLEKEIKEYQENIFQTEKQAETLEEALAELELTERKLNTDMRLTGQKIARAELQIDKLELTIEDSELKISQSGVVLGAAIRDLHELESRSFVEILLSTGSISSFWSNVAGVAQFQNTIRTRLSDLKELKGALEAQKTDLEGERRNLVLLRNRLLDQHSIIEVNQNEKGRLLGEVKNREENYRNLLSERLERKEALEREIAEFEEQLRIEIDPNSLPPTGTGILSWPVENVFLTQYFGNTPFASENPQVYNNSGHNGVDFRASRGTPILSVADGMVRATGDTDKACRGVSYGKWVLVDHGNSLSSLYAHLDLIKVDTGEKLGRRELVGYSGNTGYTTGPHLHLGVFAARAVQVIDRKSRVCGTNLTLPVSPRSGYLNPLSYLPALE